jgi:hypothetical protein
VNVHTAAGTGNAMGSLVAAYDAKTPLIITAGEQHRDMLIAEPYQANRDETLLPGPGQKGRTSRRVLRTYQPRSCGHTPWYCSRQRARCFCPSRWTTGPNRH